MCDLLLEHGIIITWRREEVELDLGNIKWPGKVCSFFKNRAKKFASFVHTAVIIYPRS